MAVRFLIDEDFDNDILRGVLRKRPGLDTFEGRRTPMIPAGAEVALLPPVSGG